CGVWLDDISPGGVQCHLRHDHHISRTQPECRKTGVQGRCRWEVDGGVCGCPLKVNSYAKHIASIHLKSTARRCPDCQKVMGREDSLTRHRRAHCSARQDSG
ncbi:hypothetical protein DAEQUDRAFT_635022, partial [Daedalea quercina L-15889]